MFANLIVNSQSTVFIYAVFIFRVSKKEDNAHRTYSQNGK